jgi:hypothetical protein
MLKKDPERNTAIVQSVKGVIAGLFGQKSSLG